MKNTQHPEKSLSLSRAIKHRMVIDDSVEIWTPVDFRDLGLRNAIDQALYRLVRSKEIRRITRGLYDVPIINKLTGKMGTPDYRKVIEALTRRDQTRMLIDGMTAANDLGLTDAIPGKVIIHTDAKHPSIQIGNQTIVFKQTAASKLYWAGHPAMRIVQALHWLRDLLPQNKAKTIKQLMHILSDPKHGKIMKEDLKENIHTLPFWMQNLISENLILS